MTRKNQISHQTKTSILDDESTQSIVAKIKERITKSDRLNLSRERTLELVDQLAQFELGQFLLHNQGLNGFWTAYLLRDPDKMAIRHPLEDWLLKKSLFKLIRDRFGTFQREIQKRLTSDSVLASVPCGLMDDLIRLDFSKVERVKLVGIDMDPESISFAKQNAAHVGIQNQVEFLESDAWQLGLKEQFNLISSNGLNMYEADEARLIQLYRKFYEALVPGGSLLISFLPPPPPENSPPQDICKQFGISLEDMKQDRAIFDDIIQATYFKFCTESRMIEQLKAAGFVIEEIHYNAQGVVPVAVAVKP